MKKLPVLLICIFLFSLVFAQGEMPLNMPALIISPPEGTPPPAEMPPDPEAMKNMLPEMFFKQMDKNNDKKLSLYEFQEWIFDVVVPPMGSPPPHEGGGMHIPPECTEQLRESELSPQRSGEPCNGGEGNLVFRTVCDVGPYDSEAISLPGGRTAACFGIEARTPNYIALTITDESDGTIFFDSRAGALEDIHSLVLAPTSDNVYRINLLPDSDAGARVTVRFVDY